MLGNRMSPLLSLLLFWTSDVCAGMSRDQAWNPIGYRVSKSQASAAMGQGKARNQVGHCLQTPPEEEMTRSETSRLVSLEVPRSPTRVTAPCLCGRVHGPGELHGITQTSSRKQAVRGRTKKRNPPHPSLHKPLRTTREPLQSPPLEKLHKRILPEKIWNPEGVYFGGFLGVSMGHTRSDLNQRQVGNAVENHTHLGGNAALGGGFLGAHVALNQRIFLNIEGFLSAQTLFSRDFQKPSNHNARFLSLELRNVVGGNINLGIQEKNMQLYLKGGVVSGQWHVDSTVTIGHLGTYKRRKDLNGYLVGAGCRYHLSESVSLGFEWTWSHYQSIPLKHRQAPPLRDMDFHLKPRTSSFLFRIQRTF